ncbi:ATP-binding protein [Streptomyces sp. NBC_00691]|uniref:ATP-binding protein n=1 Tax=Streptomyces sp. NBC_00691 TaxID=2903671 RepID=UPI003FA79433
MSLPTARRRSPRTPPDPPTCTAQPRRQRHAPCHKLRPGHRPEPGPARHPVRPRCRVGRTRRERRTRFELFVRLVDARSRDRGGTGLGLPITRELAHRQGILVFVPSDTGACFQLRLPHPPPPAKAER